MDRDDVRVFLAVARHKGLSGAAWSLKVSPQTIGRRMSALELQLGSPLFIRGPNGYELTSDGESLLHDAEGLEQQVANLQARALGRSTSHVGTVRVAAAENFVSHLLLPSLGPFVEQHPGLRIEFVTGVAPVNLLRGDADIAVRLIRPENGELTQRRVGTMINTLFAAPQYLTANQSIRSQPFERARLIG